MLDALTQEQTWGLEYLRKLHNDAVDQYNVGIDERNRYIPRDQPLQEKREKLDLDEFATLKLAEIANAGYSQLVAFKEQEALRLFRSKSPEEQAALVAQLQIPDVLTEE